MGKRTIYLNIIILLKLVQILVVSIMTYFPRGDKKKKQDVPEILLSLVKQ